jgi:hypothetical protein
MAVGPNVYNLGGSPELRLEFFDLNSQAMTPNEYRLSIKEPTGAIITVSGAGLTTTSGYFSYIYRPPVVGWYEYEGWGKDGAGREIAQTWGFEVVDRLYP